MPPKPPQIESAAYTIHIWLSLPRGTWMWSASFERPDRRVNIGTGSHLKSPVAACQRAAYAVFKHFFNHGVQ